MSLFLQLYNTYEKCCINPDEQFRALLPICHTVQQAHIEVTIDGNGKFIDAKALEKREETIIPATEKSAGRTSGEAAHPMADKIQYCAGDYAEFGGKKNSYFDGYLTQLREWCASPHAHPKAEAVLKYIEKGCLIEDLIRKNILFENNKVLLTSWEGRDADKPVIFKQLMAKNEGGESIQDQGDAFVRWRVQIPGYDDEITWNDKSLQKSWIQFDLSNKEKKGICYITGEELVLAEQHPARLRNGGDKAKIVSSNDSSNFTFRGRFETAEEACGIGFDVTQKAHNALRWILSSNRTYTNGDQVIASWENGGNKIPQPLSSTQEILELTTYEPDDKEDSAKIFAENFKKKMNGYRVDLIKSDGINVLILESATPGRMSVCYFRELSSSDFLDRLENWHITFAWHLDYVNHNFIGAPVPGDIIEASYGRDVANKEKSKNLIKSVTKRILPCIVDGAPFPKDLLHSAVERASQPQNMDDWEWRKTLSIACALYKGVHKKEGYSMSLETDRKTRDYLYGRLLAVADFMESRALYLSKEERDTTAIKLMTRFSNHPYSTWPLIEMGLIPYKSRLRAKGQLNQFEILFQEINDLFSGDDFRNDTKLSGEFLLAYHCQLKKLWEKIKNKPGETDDPDAEEE